MNSQVTDIRAVVFDFGGVLCFPPNAGQIAHAAGRCGLSSEQFLRAFWSIRIPYDAGQLAPEQYWKMVAEQTGRSFDDGLIAEMIETEIEFWSRLDQGVMQWNDQLRALGFRTAMLSNLPSPLGRRLRSRNFYGHFDHATLSFELGVVKPQREIYEDVVRGLGIAPGNALFLDDKEENVKGALSIGMNAELFTSWDAFAANAPARYALPAPASLVARRQ